MKCPNCGAPLKMEDKFCTYCGAPNTLAQKHQAEMEHFQREFAQTQNDVVTKSRRAGFHTGMLVVSIIMLVLVTVAGFICSRTWDIRYARTAARVNEHTEEYKEILEQLIADKDYASLREYYYALNLSSSDRFREYDAILRYASDLSTVYQNLCDTDVFSYRTGGLADNVKYMSEDLISLYEDPRTSYFSDEAVTDDKLAVIEDIRHQAEAILVAYAGFTPEEAAGIKDMSKSRVEELLTAHLQKVDEEREAALKAAQGSASGDISVEDFLKGEIGGDGK